MEITEVSTPSAPQAMLQAYSPTAGELRLIQWSIGHRAYINNPRVVRAIENFIYRKPGASLDLLSTNELNALKIQAVTLSVSLAR